MAMTPAAPLPFYRYRPDDRFPVLERPLRDDWPNPAVPHVRRLYPAALDELVIGRDPDGSPLLDPWRLKIAGDPIGWLFHLPWIRNPLPMNKKRHGHWAQDARDVAGVRDLAYALGRSIPAQDRIRVRLDWEVTDRRDRDEDNLVRCMKALVDGIRIAGVVPKDTREFVLRDMPEIHYAPASASRVQHFRLWVLTASV